MLFLRAGVFSLVIAGVNGILHPLPNATPLLETFSFDGWTPKPTMGPRLELLRRQDDPGLCGFVDGDSSEYMRIG